jgi:hypothetical protein
VEEEREEGEPDEGEAFGAGGGEKAGEEGDEEPLALLVGEEGDGDEKGEGELREFAEGMEEDERLSECEDECENGEAVALVAGDAHGDEGHAEGEDEAGEADAAEAEERGAEGVDGRAEGAAPDVREIMPFLPGEAGVEVMGAGVGFEEAAGSNRRGEGERGEDCDRKGERKPAAVEQ